MKTLLILGCTLALTSAGLAGDEIPLNYGLGYGSWCQYGVRYDSYGRGLDSVFSGQDLRPATFDEKCYGLGIQAALDALTQSDCRTDFAQGKSHGLIADEYGAGSPCYVLGYVAGRADLNIQTQRAR